MVRTDVSHPQSSFHNAMADNKKAQHAWGEGRKYATAAEAQARIINQAGQQNAISW